MTIFQLIKIILDNLFQKIEGASDDEKKQKIEEQFSYLSSRYLSLKDCERLATEESVDYRNPITRFAYVYKYVTHHANIIYQILHESDLQGYIQSLDRIKLAGIGGGPGSELLGILKFLNEHKIDRPLKFILCDSDKTWINTWSKVTDYLKTNFDTDYMTVPIDVCDKDDWMSMKDSYQDANIVVFSYFLSEIYCKQADALEFFFDLFESADDYTVFIFVDNNTREFYEWFDSMVKSYGITTSKKYNDRITLGDSREQKTDLEVYYHLFDEYPKLSGNVAYRICQKLPKPMDLDNIPF